MSATREQMLEKAISDACDLLAERTYGNTARSPGHNARLRLEQAIVASVYTDAPAQHAKEQVAAQVLLAMSDKVGSDTYGVSYALKINKARAERAADSILSVLTPAACEQPDIDALAQFIRDAEREHGQCDDDDTYISYRPTARAILQKFDVRPKHSSTVGGGK